jgi:nitroreductase
MVFNMDVLEAIKKRRSVRAYEPTAVPREKLERILEAARLAPSAGNIQPWHFIVVMDANKRSRLAKAPFAGFLKEAPVVIVGCGNQKASPRWFMVDVAIAMQNMVLAATAEGFGTCWVGSFNEDEVREMLKIPSDYRVVALLALGYSRRKHDFQGEILHLIRRRKKMEEIVSFEEFGRKSGQLVTQMRG